MARPKPAPPRTSGCQVRVEQKPEVLGRGRVRVHGGVAAAAVVVKGAAIDGSCIALDHHLQGNLEKKEGGGRFGRGKRRRQCWGGGGVGGNECQRGAGNVGRWREGGPVAWAPQAAGNSPGHASQPHPLQHQGRRARNKLRAQPPK
eukprot:scaffold22870_cov72-Isochrysis_galbana.AAC.1